MNVLQVPIVDEFWVAPQDPASGHRSSDFAIAMGLGGHTNIICGFAADVLRSRIRFYRPRLGRDCLIL